MRRWRGVGVVREVCDRLLALMAASWETVVTGDSISRVKQAIRERVWELLEREHVTEPGVRGYIPAFAGAEIAAGLLAGTPAWKAARVIKAVPDRAQQPVRERALRDGKLLYMAVPRLDRKSTRL